MDRRQRLLEQMNPGKGKRAHSVATQELTLLLHDLSVSLPEGWIMGFDIADDLPQVDSAGVERSNLDIRDSEHKAEWRTNLAAMMAKREEQAIEAVRREAAMDADAEHHAEDLSAIPTLASSGSGHHVVLQFVHPATNTQAIVFVPREELAAIVASDERDETERTADLAMRVQDGHLLPEAQRDALQRVIAPHLKRAQDRIAEKSKRMDDAVAARKARAVQREARLNDAGVGRRGR